MFLSHYVACAYVMCLIKNLLTYLLQIQLVHTVLNCNLLLLQLPTSKETCYFHIDLVSNAYVGFVGIAHN